MSSSSACHSVLTLLLLLLLSMSWELLISFRFPSRRRPPCDVIIKFNSIELRSRGIQSRRKRNVNRPDSTSHNLLWWYESPLRHLLYYFASLVNMYLSLGNSSSSTYAFRGRSERSHRKWISSVEIESPVFRCEIPSENFIHWPFHPTGFWHHTPTRKHFPRARLQLDPALEMDL